MWMIYSVISCKEAFKNNLADNIQRILRNETFLGPLVQCHDFIGEKMEFINLSGLSCGTQKTWAIIPSK